MLKIFKEGLRKFRHPEIESLGIVINSQVTLDQLGRNMDDHLNRAMRNGENRNLTFDSDADRGMATSFIWFDDTVVRSYLEFITKITQRVGRPPRNSAAFWGLHQGLCGECYLGAAENLTIRNLSWIDSGLNRRIRARPCHDENKDVVVDIDFTMNIIKNRDNANIIAQVNINGLSFYDFERDLWVNSSVVLRLI